MTTYSYSDVAKTIDHSLLRPELTLDAVRKGCALAAEYDVASVCVRPADVALAAELLADSDVLVGTVVGFPHGSSTTAVKVLETEEAIRDGADEIDMVINIGWLLSGSYDQVEEEIRRVVEAAQGRDVKVILENAYLNDEQKREACRRVEAAGAHYVKTSTGFAPSGATLEDVRLMKESVSPSVKVKSAGGVRTLDVLFEYLDAGISRTGATTTAQMLDEYQERFGAE